MEPVSGFAHTAISAMFNLPPATSTPPDSPTQPIVITTAQIAGSVIGAVVGISIIVVMFLWVIRRKRKAPRCAESNIVSTQRKEDVDSVTQELSANSMLMELEEQRCVAELDGEAVYLNMQRV